MVACWPVPLENVYSPILVGHPPARGRTILRVRGGEERQSDRENEKFCYGDSDQELHRGPSGVRPFVGLEQRKVFNARNRGWPKLFLSASYHRGDTRITSAQNRQVSMRSKLR